MREVQSELKDWVEYNFGGRPTYHPLLGVVEEVGELSHAFLKMEQGIRVEENHEENIRDAIGDILIYLLDFCNAIGVDSEDILKETWNNVKLRDWVKYPEGGMKP